MKFAFKIGDKVKYKKAWGKEVVCPLCNGNQTIPNLEGHRTCPHCYCDEAGESYGKIVELSNEPIIVKIIGIKKMEDKEPVYSFFYKDGSWLLEYTETELCEINKPSEGFTTKFNINDVVLFTKFHQEKGEQLQQTGTVKYIHLFLNRRLFEMYSIHQANQRYIYNIEASDAEKL